MDDDIVALTEALAAVLALLDSHARYRAALMGTLRILARETVRELALLGALKGVPITLLREGRGLGTVTSTHLEPKGGVVVVATEGGEMFLDDFIDELFPGGRPGEYRLTVPGCTRRDPEEHVLAIADRYLAERGDARAAQRGAARQDRPAA